VKTIVKPDGVSRVHRGQRRAKHRKAQARFRATPSSVRFYRRFFSREFLGVSLTVPETLDKKLIGRLARPFGISYFRMPVLTPIKLS